MAEFLEERLAVSVRNGSAISDDYALEIVSTAAGSEYRRLLHPLPIRRWGLSLSSTFARLVNAPRRLFLVC